MSSRRIVEGDFQLSFWPEEWETKQNDNKRGNAFRQHLYNIIYFWKISANSPLINLGHNGG